VSEPNVIHDSLTAEEVKPADYDTSVEMGRVAAQDVEQLEIHLEPLAGADRGVDYTIPPSEVPSASPFTDTERQFLEREHAALLEELLQTQSLTHGYVERIRHLEQALDQSQASLRELQHQMVDQQFLERQLAATEEISNIQQQAVTRLKLQLEEKQQTLTDQISEAQARDRSLQALLAAMEAQTERQQTELESLRSQIARDRTELQVYNQSLKEQIASLQSAFDAQHQRILELEAQFLSAHTHSGELEVQLEQSQKQVGELNHLLEQHQSRIDHLEAELNKAQTTIEQQPTLILDVPQSPRSRKLSPASERELAIAQNKVEELETEIARQLTTQAMLQHACLELEQERGQHQTRMAELERQIADMQEQILRQARQASEYETAVQHLKDRYFSTQTSVLKLQELLQPTLADLPPEVAAILADLQAATRATELPSTTVLPTPQTPRVDLPEFLLRRRSRVGTKPSEKKA
jgi:chromosome segregation ATPase